MMPALLDPFSSVLKDREARLLERLDSAIGVLSAWWMRTHEVWPNYTTDLGLEALLACYDATGDAQYLHHVEKVWNYRHPPAESLTVGNSYFTCVHYETYLRTGEARYIEGFLELAEDWIARAPRSAEGAFGHRKKPEAALFVDLLAGLAPMLARAGALSGDSKFHDECVRQIRLYRDALFDPIRGLWHHARDWHGPGSLAPAGWCRGSGWVLRGLEKSLAALPKDHPGRESVEAAFVETLRGLLARQDPCGLWHQLVQDPQSPLETSGSGFILTALASPQLLENPSIKPPFITGIHLLGGVRGLFDFVDSNGKVSNGCPECPPLPSESHYLELELDSENPHAMAAVLLAFASARGAWGKGWF